MEKQKIAVFLAGRIPSKKNSKQMVFARGRRFIIPSKQYIMWHDEKEDEIRAAMTAYRLVQLPLTKVEIKITITFPDNIKADLTNKAESIMDLLVDVGILEDDNHKVCQLLTLISGGVDKTKSGAQIEISY